MLYTVKWKVRFDKNFKWGMEFELRYGTWKSFSLYVAHIPLQLSISQFQILQPNVMCTFLEWDMRNAFGWQWEMQLVSYLTLKWSKNCQDFLSIFLSTFSISMLLFIAFLKLTVFCGRTAFFQIIENFHEWLL